MIMNTRTIPLMPAAKLRGKTEIIEYCRGAWSFANTVLWPEQHFDTQELERAKVCIQNYFDDATDMKKAFLSFCQRIILTHRYITAQPGRFVPNPSIWFNGNYPQGFVGTLAWLNNIEKKREEIPGYLQHILTAAEQYVEYVEHPTTKAFNTCRTKLLQQNAKSLLQFYYNSILHFNYIKY